MSEDLSLWSFTHSVQLFIISLSIYFTRWHAQFESHRPAGCVDRRDRSQEFFFEEQNIPNTFIRSFVYLRCHLFKKAPFLTTSNCVFPFQSLRFRRETSLLIVFFSPSINESAARSLSVSSSSQAWESPCVCVWTRDEWYSSRAIFLFSRTAPCSLHCHDRRKSGSRRINNENLIKHAWVCQSCQVSKSVRKWLARLCQLASGCYSYLEALFLSFSLALLKTNVMAEFRRPQTQMSRLSEWLLRKVNSGLKRPENGQGQYGEGKRGTSFRGHHTELSFRPESSRVFCFQTQNSKSH